MFYLEAHDVRNTQVRTEGSVTGTSVANWDWNAIMRHILYVWRGKAYNGEIALAREGKLLNSSAAQQTETLEDHPKLVYRVRYGETEELLTDPVAVHHATQRHPSGTVDILPVVA